MGLVRHEPYLPQHIISVTVLLALLSCYPVSEQIEKRGAVEHVVTHVSSTSAGTVVKITIDNAADKDGITEKGPVKDDVKQSDAPAIEDGVTSESGQKEGDSKPVIGETVENTGEGQGKLESGKLDDGKPESGKLESGKVEGVADKPGVEVAKPPVNANGTKLSEKPKEPAENTTEIVLNEEVVDVVPVAVEEDKKGKKKKKGDDTKEDVVIKSEIPKKEEVKEEVDLKPVEVKDLVENPPFDVNKVFATMAPEQATETKKMPTDPKKNEKKTTGDEKKTTSDEKKTTSDEKKTTSDEKKNTGDTTAVLKEEVVVAINETKTDAKTEKAPAPITIVNNGTAAEEQKEEKDEKEKKEKEKLPDKIVSFDLTAGREADRLTKGKAETEKLAKINEGGAKKDDSKKKDEGKKDKAKKDDTTKDEKVEEKKVLTEQVVVTVDETKLGSAGVEKDQEPATEESKKDKVKISESQEVEGKTKGKTEVKTDAKTEVKVVVTVKTEVIDEGTKSDANKDAVKNDTAKKAEAQKNLEVKNDIIEKSKTENKVQKSREVKAENIDNEVE